jgi:minor extracellular serine protease Vpr
MNSGDPSGITDYSARRAGTGMVNAAAAVGTMAYAFADRDETTANFGLEEFSTDLTGSKTVHVHNDATTPVTFNVAVQNKAGSPHTVTLSASQVTVPARGNATVDMNLTLPAATAGNSDAFRDVAGLITFTPTTSTANRGYSLKVPYYLVPRVSSNVDAALALPKKATTGVVAVTNQGSPIPATADFYAWGLEDNRDRLGRFDARAVGVQSFPVSATDQLLVFAVNTFKGWSTPVSDEFDIRIDVDGDTKDDFIVFNVDFGLLSGTGLFNGQEVVAVLNVATQEIDVQFLTAASTDSSTMLLPVLASQLGLTGTKPRITYRVSAFDFFGDAGDDMPGAASFNAYHNAITTGQFATVDPNTTVGVPVAIDSAEAKITPPLGYMIVTQDNKNGPGEAKLIRMKF